MKEIEEFKQKNGGVISYTVKELIGALHIKMDRMKEEYDNHCKKTSKKITVVETLCGIHTVIIIGLLWMVFSG